MSGKRARITDFYSRNSRPRVATGPGGGRRGPGGRITTINPNKLVLRARNMLRSYASRTMTMQQRKRRNVTKLSDGLTTVSSFRKGYRLKPFLLPLLKTAAPQYQVIRFGRRLSSGINALLTLRRCLIQGTSTSSWITREISVRPHSRHGCDVTVLGDSFPS